MKAVILAAGMPHESFPRDDKQKTLYKVNGEVLLERTVNQLREAGIKDVRVVIGYGAEGIRKFNLEKKLDLDLVYNPQWETDAITSIRTGIKDLGDDALILYADILARTDVFRLFLECEAPLVWIKLLRPWGRPWPIGNDEIYRGDRSICIVKVAEEKLGIFDKAEEYVEQWMKRYRRGETGGSGILLDALLLEAMYQNGPVADIVLPMGLKDVDRYKATDEGKEAARDHLLARAERS